MTMLHARRAFVLGSFLLVGLALRAQYLLGASGGGMLFELRSRSVGDPHTGASFDPGPGPFWTACIFYREQHFDHTNLGLELIYTRKEFEMHYGNTGLAGSYGTAGFVELDLLHLAIIPQVSLGASKRAVVRFGLMQGILLRGRISGREWYHVGGTNYDRTFENEPTKDFGGDLRLFFGFGFEMPMGERIRLLFDPYFTTAISSLLKEDPRSKGMEWGLRTGLALRMPGTTISEWMDRITPATGSGY
jgi:hypothetical protein